MINDAQKAFLKDLLDQERVSDILQTMLTIARRGGSLGFTFSLKPTMEVF